MASESSIGPIKRPRTLSRRPSILDQNEALLELSRKFSTYGPLINLDEDHEEDKSSAQQDSDHEGQGGTVHMELSDRDRWISLSIAFVVTFLLTVQNSIYWNSLWPYLSTIDKSANESFFGVIIMIFNLASALASPLFGYWSNRIQQCRIPIITGICMTIVGNLLLAFVEAFTNNRKWVLFGARFITGLGIGNYGALYAYIVMASTMKERNKAVSIRAAVNSAAVMIGPALQAAFVPIGHPGIVRGAFHFDTYTAPAWINIGLGFVQIGVVAFFFKECWISVEEGKKGSDGLEKKLKPYDKLAVGVCIWTRLTQMFCFTYDTTIGSPLTMVMFGWSPTQAVMYNGIIQVVSASIDFCGNLIMGNLILRFIKERLAILVGISTFILFFIISFPYPGLPPLIPTSFEKGGNFTLGQSNQSLSEGTTSTCNYSWCNYTSKIYLSQYLVAYGCLVFSVSVAFTPNATLFSKILGPRKQGTLQGLFAASGQLAMTIAPLLVSTLFNYLGPRVTNAVGGLVLISTTILVLATYKRLVPWTPDENDDEKAPLINRGDGKMAEFYGGSQAGSTT